jgi:hypothetical protein
LNTLNLSEKKEERKRENQVKERADDDDDHLLIDKIFTERERERATTEHSNAFVEYMCIHWYIYIFQYLLFSYKHLLFFVFIFVRLFFILRVWAMVFFNQSSLLSLSLSFTYSLRAAHVLGRLD